MSLHLVAAGKDPLTPPDVHGGVRGFGGGACCEDPLSVCT